MFYSPLLNNALAEINFTDGINENGVKNVVLNLVTKCAFFEKTKTLYGDEYNVINTAIILFDDFGSLMRNNIKKFEGEAFVNGKNYKIISGRYVFDINGKVSHIELELM